MTVKYSGLALACLLCLSVSVNAQNPNPVLQADSMATGNYKDVLNSFFQLAFNRLVGPDKEIRFTGTPFAVMAKLDTTLLLDKKYVQYKALRNLNYSFGLGLDTSYRFNGFSSGIKYALVNKRDETVSKAFLFMVETNPLIRQLNALDSVVSRKVMAAPVADRGALAEEYDELNTGAKKFASLSPQLKKMITDALTELKSQDLLGRLQNDAAFNVRSTADSVYQKLRTGFNKKALWTIGVTDTTYKDQFVFSNVVFHTEFLKGIDESGKHKNDVELDIKSALQLVDDTLKAGRDLKRALFSFEPGINVAFKTKHAKKSYLELMFSGGYYHNFGQLYANEERDRIFVNGTVRVRIFNDIWVPFQVKYDPKNGNLFGFINVRANFKALGQAAKQL